MTGAARHVRDDGRRPPDGEPLLKAEHVTKRFGGLVAVNDVSFDIPRGSIVSLIGPERRGQDDVLQHHRRHLRPDRGSVRGPGPEDDRPPGAAARAVRVGHLPAHRGADHGGLAPRRSSETTGIAGVCLTLGALTTMLISAVARPAWYTRLLARLGIFRSARPNDMVEAGLGRTFRTSACSRT